MKTYFIEQEKKAAKAVEELKRQEAAETLASLQHGRPPQAPNNKFYDDNKGLEAHQKRRHPRPPVPNDERDADGEREA